MIKKVIKILIGFFIFLSIINVSFSSVQNSSPNFTTIVVNDVSYNMFSYYDISNEDFAIRFAEDVSNANINQKDYNAVAVDWLDDSKCKITYIDYNTINEELSLKANFASILYIFKNLTSNNYSLYFEGNTYNINNLVNEQILKSNYYMKTFVFLRLVDEEGFDNYEPYSEIFVFPEKSYLNKKTRGIYYYNYNNNLPNKVLEKYFYRSDDNLGYESDGKRDYVFYNNNFYGASPSSFFHYSNPRVPHVLLKPGTNEIKFNLSGLKQRLEEMGYGNRNYKIEAYAIPIDGKCDFDGNNYLGNSEIEIKNADYSDSFKTGEIITISNFITFANTNNMDLKVNISNPKHIFFKGIEVHLPNIPGYIKGGFFQTYTSKDMLKFLYWLKKKHFKNLDTESEIQNKVEGITKKIEKINISINYNNITKEANVSIINKYVVRTKNDTTPQNKNVTTFYAILSKNTNPKNVRIYSDKNLTWFWTDLDPIIGWQFEDEVGNVTIEGTEEEPVIVVVDEPIIYNKGNIVINYRKNCSTDELELLKVEDITGGRVTTDLTKNYNWSVCLNTLEDTILNNSNTEINSKNLFNISISDLFNNSGINKVFISSSNNSLWFNVKYEEEPEGNYSCLGSYDLTTGKFGDCGFTTDRIWLRLDEDNTPPLILYDYPKVSHQINLKIEVEDDLSGVNKSSIKYCITNRTKTCTPSFNYNLGETITLTCDKSSLSCHKKLITKASDLAGNTIEYNETIYISKTGSICQPDCTVYPIPGRIVKSCDGINGCKFLNKEVAEACHMAKKGSWVLMPDLLTEVKCPNGPIRPSIFTNLTLSVNYLNDECLFFYKIKKPFLVNSKIVNLNIYFCKNY